MNVSGAEFSPWNGQTFPSAADWTYLQSKGVKFVRLPIAWESIQPTLLGALDATYLSSVNTALSRAAVVGISVIVEIHNFGYYCDQAHWVSTGCGYAGNAGSAGTGVIHFGDGNLTSAHFADLWTRLTTALVGMPGLTGYGIMNEPSQNITGTNLIFAPNGFGDTVGSQPWFPVNASVATQLAAGTNPLGSTYGPAWNITSGSGFGGWCQSITLANSPYTIDVYASIASGTVQGYMSIAGTQGTFTATTTPTRVTPLTVTPTAGAQNVCLGVNTAGANTIRFSNAQLVAGSAEVAYQPNPYIPYAQAAISAIRAVDPITPIYVNGYAIGTAYLWPWVNWELPQLTGGNLVFEAHQYFDGAVSQGGGGGIYSGTYTSYSITQNAGVAEVEPFLAWLTTTGVKGFLGEFNIVNSATDANSQWFGLQGSFLQTVRNANVRGTAWFYNSNDIQSGNNLGMMPVAGVDDARLLQLLAIH